jgi:conjugative transfer signal peptidase TraF
LELKRQVPLHEFYLATRTLLLAALVCMAAAKICAIIGLRINFSPSLPVGLYLTADHSATLVEFCPPEPFASLALARGYRSRGNCPDGGAPLLKPVVAKATDVIEVSARGITVNGNMLPNSAPLNCDIQGRRLNPWPFGQYVVVPNTVWVVSSYSLRSFDSRYFGPVSTGLVRDHVRPLLTLWK